MAGKMEWHKIAADAEELIFDSNNITVINCNNKQVCVAQYNNQLFAFAYLCPHASGIMANGYIDPLGNVVCPIHRYKFSMSNGRNVSGEGYHLKTYPIEIRGEGVFMGMQKSGWLGF
jgi:3-phenylpropionate/trans-cinnamate dioxygenase ferredoxin subunit